MSLINNQIDIYTSPTLEPNFDWQVGFNNFNSVTSGVNFRVTVRPLTSFEQFSRIPNSTVLFEETGVVLNNNTNLGLWQFTFQKNLSCTGGPYRDYQIVVEAHDSDGNTSAGNIIGTQGDAENGWTAYPNGYDIVAVQNPRPSGIELSFNLPTQVSSTGNFISITNNLYQSQQFMGSNGEIIIKFTSGIFESGIVGGFLYTSATQFPKQDIFSPTSFYGSRVEQTRFDFDINNPFVYNPHAAFNVRGAPYCFVSISFFDELDNVLLNKGIDISTGLYMSNNTPFYNDGAVGSLSMGGAATFFTVQTTGYPLISGARWSGLVGSGASEITRVSTQGALNIPQNLTTIFYMALGITGFYTGIGGGQPGGLGGGSTNNITGRTPGGYGTGTLVGVGFDANNHLVYRQITGLKVGDSIVSFQMPLLTGNNLPYNSSIDNWDTCHYTQTGLLANSSFTGNFTSGFITNIGSSLVSGYTTLLSNFMPGQIDISYEQPIYLSTGTDVNFLAYTGKFFQSSVISKYLIFTGFSFTGPPLSYFCIYGNNSNIPMVKDGILNGFNQSLNQSQATGTFYYLQTSPYNLFFVNSSQGAAGNRFGILTHNSLYNY